MLNKNELNKYHQLFYRFRLRPFQKDWFNKIISNRYSLIVGSRQIGKSYLAGYAAIILCLGYNGSTGHNVHIVSKDDRNSKLIIEKIVEHLNTIEDVVESVKHDKLGSASRITLKNGCYIQSFPGKAESLRGFTGTVLIDEIAASNEDMDELFAMAASVASAESHFKIIGLTNAGSEGSWLHDFLTSEKPSWIKRRNPYSITITNIYDAYGNDLPEHVTEIKNSISPRLWRREYECEFVGGEGGYFETDVVNLSNIELNIEGSSVLSIDPGFTRNPSGVVVGLCGNGKIDVIHSDLWFGKGLDEQINLVEKLKKQYNFNKIVVDSGTAGMLLAQKLEQKYGTKVVDRVFASRQKQNKWAEQAESLLKTNSIKIDPHHTYLIDDLNSLGVDKLNNLVVPERRHKNTKFYIHADSAMALLQLTDYSNISTIKRSFKLYNSSNETLRW